MTILKSINIAEDFEFPVRASHYRPTSKSIDIVRSVIGPNSSQATNVIASYGSGKSIAAMVGGLLVEADAKKIKAINDVGLRLKEFDPSISKLVTHRKSIKAKGAVVVLSGHVPDLASAIAKSLDLTTPESMTGLFRALESHLKKRGHDRFAIIWDEFGRHLEALVSKGRAEDLALVQDLAEWTTRRKSPIATLTILLHQEHHRYSGRLGQAEQTAWKKIEGRFDTLRIIEESDEIYGFIADIVDDLECKGRCRIGKTTAHKTHELGLFPFLKDERAVHKLLKRVAPLTPAAFYLLPKIAGRVGQSERTIYGFLGTEMPVDRGGVVGVEDVYRYFSDAMRTDTGIGGSHRRYIETESARSRASNASEREVLAATALLHLAASGDETKIGRERLVSFLNLDVGGGGGNCDSTVDGLLERKLLLHRQLTDEISVWHGADVDLRSLTSEAAENLRGKDSTVERIQSLVPSPVYLAPKYNYLHRLTRFAQGVFVELADLQDPKRLEKLLSTADREDAIVALVVDAAREDFSSINKRWFKKHPHLIIAIANQRPDLEAICLEAAALKQLAQDQDLLEMDPLVEREILELRSNALEYLASRAALLTDPEAGAVTWYSGGESLGTGDSLQAAESLSNVLDRRFTCTPNITNEQIVRNKVTAQTKSARKRLLLGILERSSVSDMGYADATTSDASIYRTTLVATELYDRERSKWREPQDLKDTNLAEIWKLLKDFYGRPSTKSKSFADIIEKLSSAPFGVRKGVLPIFVTAALRAFGEVIAIRKHIHGSWRYIDDIQPSTMEDICENPTRFEIEVVKTTRKQRELIVQLIGEFSAIPDTVETDLIRAFYDALESWRRNLPAAALTASGLGEAATKLQEALRQTGGDPVSLLFRAFPTLTDRNKLDDGVVAFVANARRQIERMTLKYVEDAIQVAKDAFLSDLEAQPKDVLEAAHEWASQIPDSVSADPALDRISKGVLNRARRARSETDSEASFLRALSAMLIGREFEEWDDATSRQFARELRLRIREVEDAALSLDKKDPEISPFLERKIEIYLSRLIQTAGQKNAMAFITKLERSMK